MKISKIFAVAAVFCTVLATSCTKETPVPTAMSLDKTTVDIFVGQTACVTPEFTPSNAKATSLVWTSSDDKVATVDGGYVKGIKAGSATITGKAQGTITATCTVTVKNVEAESFTLDKTEATLYENEAGITLTATVLPYNVTFPEVTWTSSNEAVATVSEKGEVTPVAVGNADITASLVSGKKVTCKVKVTLRVPTEPETLDFWKSDNASYRGLFGAAADEGKTAGEGGWLYYSEGIAYWKENTTGAIRTATLTLSTGSSITIKQIGVKEIVGNYSFNAKIFKGTGGIYAKADYSDISTTISVKETPETLVGADEKSYTNNATISGIFGSMVLDAAFNVDYDKQTAQLGLFLDTRDGSGQLEGGKYGVFFPGLCSKTASAWGSPWWYNEVELGTPDYTWLWLDYDITTGTFSLKNRTSADDPIQELTQYYDETARYMCGFGVIFSSTNVFDHTTCGARATSGYANFFQFNPTGNAMQFVKK